MKETKMGRRKGPGVKLNMLVFVAATIIFALIAFQVGHQIASNLETQQAAALIQVAAPNDTTASTTSAASSDPPTSTPLATGNVTQTATEAATTATATAT